MVHGGHDQEKTIMGVVFSSMQGTKSKECARMAVDTAKRGGGHRKTRVWVVAVDTAKR